MTEKKSKAQHIREALDKAPQAGIHEIVAALKKSGVHVATQQVHGELAKRKRKTTSPHARIHIMGREYTLDEIKAIHDFYEQVKNLPK